MHHLFGGGMELAWVAVKALLLYVTAVVGFRVAGRRTLAEMSPFDFVVAVAVGAIVGRVPNTSATSYLAGAVTLITLLIAHWLIARAKFIPNIAYLVEPPPGLVVANGRVLKDELWRYGLTVDDLRIMLRQNGVSDIEEARYVVFEPSGQVSVIRRDRSDASKRSQQSDSLQ